ncbi:MAG: flagellar export protein FliJ [Formivibrio sp.]|nr:flagellar export protein FliJ [Formivibrio sp.]
MAEFRFDFLLKLALDEREEAAKVLQVAQSAWLAARAKQEQVDAFRCEYRNRLTTSGQSGMTVTQWRDFQLFLSRLDMAAKQQVEEVALHEARYQQALEVWQACEKKVKGFDALKDRHQLTEQRKEGVREQKQLDEFNSRQSRSSR